MYTPPYFKMTNRKEALGFMQQYPFGTLVTVTDGIPLATHLPFCVEQNDDGLTLTSHLARANNHGYELEGKRGLIIFQEPHAYVSPSHYEKKENVPTWNYVAVHASGKINLVPPGAPTLAALERTIVQFEPEYLEQWHGLPLTFRQNMANGILAFTLVVDQLEGTKKLSQNKTILERERIANAFITHPDSSAKDVGTRMLQELKNH